MRDGQACHSGRDVKKDTADVPWWS
jgi:hypothetical protein